ncbi:hypothetical protein B296_00037623 [Ensete ventricosum]|uniref:Uncharacterized protein n=1 Tax=Ensete ventricosum TaxID=4639 RepID=A0A426Z2Q6_ENSVE|nr:hypothetical protein B296_00037623 [Ensete ventricosum]
MNRPGATNRPQATDRAGKPGKSNAHEVFFSLFFSLFFFSFFFLPQSTADDRFWRYHPVAGGPRARQLADRYVPLATHGEPKHQLELIRIDNNSGVPAYS